MKGFIKGWAIGFVTGIFLSVGLSNLAHSEEAAATPPAPQPCCVLKLPLDWTQKLVANLNQSTGPHVEVNALLQEIVKQVNEQTPKEK